MHQAADFAEMRFSVVNGGCYEQFANRVNAGSSFTRRPLIIDRLATADMLAMLHQDDKQISEAVGACLPDIARLIDIATATISRGGRLVIIGAGASGRTTIEAVSDYSPEGKHALVGLIAGGQTAAMAERETAANNYDLGAFELQSLDFSNRDMLLALTVSGKTPWVWGRCATPGRWAPR